MTQQPRQQRDAIAVVIAASNASRKGKFAADFVCDGTHDEAQFVAAFAAIAAAGSGTILLSDGDFYLDSASTGGTEAHVLVAPPQVRAIVGAGSGRTRLHQKSGVIGNTIHFVSTLSTVATMTANCAAGDATFTVNSTAGFSVGDDVAFSCGQNPSDTLSPRQATIARVAAIVGSTMTLDAPAEWNCDVSTQNAANHQIVRIAALCERVECSGFAIVGNSSVRHAIGIAWARDITIRDIAGTDVGSGVVNALYSEHIRVERVRVDRCQAFGNTSKGRALSFANCRGVTVDGLHAERFEGGAVYVESYSAGVLLRNIRLHNNAASRAQPYLVFAGYGCDVSVDGLVLTGNGTDSVSTASGGTGVIHFRDTTLFPALGTLRVFEVGKASGLLRLIDNNGVMQVFRLDRAVRSTVKVWLSAGMDLTVWLRDGLLLGSEVFVSANVTAQMLTGCGLSRTFVAGVDLPWTAGSLTRQVYGLGTSGTQIAGVFDQALRLRVTVAGGASLPSGAYVLLSVSTTAPEGATTSASEPGTAQDQRFAPYWEVGA